MDPTHVTNRILAGDCIFIYNSHAIRVPHSWLAAHPGGDLAILHFVGRDATDEIDAYHGPETVRTILKYSIGILNRKWTPLLPPISLGWTFDTSSSTWYNAIKPTTSSLTLTDITPPPSPLSLEIQERHSAAYKKLHRQIIDAGLYDTPYLSGYGPEFIRYILLGGLSIVSYMKNWQITSAVFLGLMWHQVLFFAHDLGHMGVTHKWNYDRLIGTFIGDVIGGLSIGWWVQVSFDISPMRLY